MGLGRVSTLSKILRWLGILVGVLLSAWRPTLRTPIAELGKKTDAINQLNKTSGDPNAAPQRKPDDAGAQFARRRRKAGLSRASSSIKLCGKLWGYSRVVETLEWRLESRGSSVRDAALAPLGSSSSAIRPRPIEASRCIRVI